MQEKINKGKINYNVLLPVLLLILVSFIAQYGAFRADPLITELGPLMYKQGLWTILGLTLMFILMFLPIDFLWKITPIFYVSTLLVMASLLKFYDPVMADATNTKRWLSLGPISFQPSEFMKIGYILMLAYIITKEKQKRPHAIAWKQDLKLIGKLVLISLPVLVLMFYQRDFGTSLVFVAVFAGMILVSGCTWRILMPLFVGGASIGGIAISLVLTSWGQKLLSMLHFKSYQFNRIYAWLNPFAYADTIGFQQARSLTAIGSGGIFGKGIHHLEVYVPVRESDMIFTVIGEAYGFIGACLLIALFFYLIYQMFITTLATESSFYAFITTGITMMFTFHIFENIGSNIGVLPLTGIPLPFISQGGTAYLSSFFAIGLILSMYYHQNRGVN